MKREKKIHLELDLTCLSLSLSLSLQMPNEGSLVLVIILIVLQGVTGISFGLVISAAMDDEQSANQAALGIFYPNLILSGRPHWKTDYNLFNIVV